MKRLRAHESNRRSATNADRPRFAQRVHESPRAYVVEACEADLALGDQAGDRSAHLRIGAHRWNPPLVEKVRCAHGEDQGHDAWRHVEVLTLGKDRSKAKDQRQPKASESDSVDDMTHQVSGPEHRGLPTSKGRERSTRADGESADGGQQRFEPEAAFFWSPRLNRGTNRATNNGPRSFHVEELQRRPLIVEVVLWQIPRRTSRRALTIAVFLSPAG